MELETARIRLRSAQGFSINRDILLAPLKSQAEGNWLLRAMLNSWERGQGEGPQQAFDAAVLDASLDEGAQTLRGEVLMVSEGLRLEVPITVDTRVITQVLQSQQESLLENLDGIRIAPPEL